MTGSLSETWDASYMHAMKWRWLPIGDDFVRLFCSRDLDSLIYEREVDSVNAWLRDPHQRAGHIMRDNPNHGTEILGGMWGFSRARDPTTAARIYARVQRRRVAAHYNRPVANAKGRDQHFLSYYVYPLLRGRSTVHDSYLCQVYRDSEPFPSRRQKSCYVGAAMPYDCMSSEQYYVCPVACRPKEHTDWTYC